ncbi:MAG: hypothetical protein ACRCTI_18180 [Beijerinckiaceae bacterium]
MLETLGDIVSGLVELVASFVYSVLKFLFRLEPGAERPAWVRAVAILLIIIAAGAIVYFAFAFFVTAFYVLVAIAAIGAVIGFLGLN